jgi:hypothetical protein
MTDGRLISDTIEWWKAAGGKVLKRLKDDRGVYAFAGQFEVLNDTELAYIATASSRYNGEYAYFHRKLAERASDNEAVLIFRLNSNYESAVEVYNPDYVLQNGFEEQADDSREPMMNVKPEAGVSLTQYASGNSVPDEPQKGITDY